MDEEEAIPAERRESIQAREAASKELLFNPFDTRDDMLFN